MKSIRLNDSTLPNDEIENRIDHLLKAVAETPAAGEPQAGALRALRARMQDLRVQLNGDSTVTSRNEPAPLAIRGRVARIVSDVRPISAPVFKFLSRLGKSELLTWIRIR